MQATTAAREQSEVRCPRCPWVVLGHRRERAGEPVFAPAGDATRVVDCSPTRVTVRCRRCRNVATVALGRAAA